MEGLMQKPLCVILMGSAADKEVAQTIIEELSFFGIEYVVRIGSAHKTPEHLLDMLSEYENMQSPKVYITIAGRSNALSGFVDGSVLSPVIACPPISDHFAGADVFSSLRMPSGIAPSLVLEPKNASLFVAKIFSLYDEQILANLVAYKKKHTDRVLLDDIEIQKQNG